jgi:Tol biopolymer transport system component
MKKKLHRSFSLVTFFVCISVLNTFAGDYKKIFASAEENFANENYAAALPLYLQLDSMDRNNANLQFKIGVCYLKSPTYKVKSIPYFEAAQKKITNSYVMGSINEKNAPISTYYYLAKAYHLNYEFDKAIAMYEQYKKEFGDDPKFKAELAEINHDIETCNNGKELVLKPRSLKIDNLGEGVNSKFADYAPVVSLDEQTLIFTSRREGGASNKKELNGLFFEDIYVSQFDGDKWGPASPLQINSPGHEATINLSADGQKLLIYKDKGGDGGIYESSSQGAGWSEPQMIAAPVNSNAWESHACYTADNRILYFISDRSGGYGGRDIYKCVKLPNGEWGPAQNLGNVINTPYDEDGVFIHPDGKQIFFSSKGHKSMGGFDIFTSFMDDENGFWTSPNNYGYPVNTTDDDVFLITTADGRRAFFSSDKVGGYGEKDLYMITFPENDPRDITVMVGKIVNNTTEDISNNQIYIIDLKTNDTIQVLSANSKTGKFGTNLPVGGKYKTVYTMNGKEFFSETLDVPKGKNYQVLRKDIAYGTPSAETLANQGKPADTGADCDASAARFELHFTYNKKEIDGSSKEFRSFIKNLAACIKAGQVVSITVESSASKVPTTSFSTNENLARLRAEAAESQIRAALLREGVRLNQINFTKQSALVQGPEYQNDAMTNRKVYEEHQFIRVRAEKK